MNPSLPKHNDKALIIQGFIISALTGMPFGIPLWRGLNGTASDLVGQFFGGSEEMLSENWLEEMLLNDESATTTIPELQMPTQEELVIREMVLLGEITEEEAMVMLNQSRAV